MLTRLLLFVWNCRAFLVYWRAGDWDHSLLAMALLCLAGSLLDAYSLLWSYRIRRMSTAHGSARWARASDLIRCGLMNKMRGLPIPSNAMPIARAFGGRDIFLPQNQWLRHFVMFGPTGSGKSNIFYFNVELSSKDLPAWSTTPKVNFANRPLLRKVCIFRLDLNDPAKSDAGISSPNDPALPVRRLNDDGVESRRRTSADPFWG